MIIVVDSSVWSLVLRRSRVDEGNPWGEAFRRHVREGDGVVLAGPILQELLTGIRWPEEFDRLTQSLSHFPLLPASRETYVLAAQISNHCRSDGVQATPADCLIAAGCVEHHYPLLTADRDFVRIAEHCGLVLLPPCRDGRLRQRRNCMT